MVMPEQCASPDERAERGDAFDGAAEIEAACGAEIADSQEACVRGTNAIHLCGSGRTVAGVLADAVL